MEVKNMESSLYPDNPILMIDDELQFLRSASFALRSQGINNIVLFYVLNFWIYRI